MDRIPEEWETRVCLYCTHLIHEEEVQSSTIRSYVSAIKYVLTTDGYEWNDRKVLLNTLTKACKVKNDVTHTRLPISRRFLEIIIYEIKRKYQVQPYLKVMYTSAFLISYYGLFRIGEIAEGAHSIKAVNVHKCSEHNKLLIILYSSKTHGRESRPQQVRIKGLNTLEVVDIDDQDNISYTYNESLFCPVKHTKLYIKLRPRIHDINEQFFVFSDGSNVKPIHIRSTLRSAIKQLGLNPHLYDTYSFRIGRATDLEKEGFSIDSIKKLGRWKSNAVYKYLRQ